MSALDDLDVAAGQLILTALTAAGTGHDSAWATKALSTPGAPLQRFAAFVAPVHDKDLSLALRTSLIEARAQLSNRNGVVHSVAMWVLDEEDGSPLRSVFWHPKTDTERSWRAADIAEIAFEIGIVTDRATALFARVEEWRRTTQAADQMRTAEAPEK